MNILDNIKNDLKSIELKVLDLRIGLSYVGALLENKNLGVAYTFLPSSHQCHLFDNLWPVRGKKVSELVDKIDLKEDIGSAILLACANGYYNTASRTDLIKGDVLEILRLTKHDVVGIVGEFKPLIGPIKSKCKELYVFERKRCVQEKNLLPEEKAYEILNFCDVVIITATSIINKSIDRLLNSISSKAKEVVVLGPSTPLNPEYFKDTPVSLLCGVLVKDPYSVLEIISLGGGMRSFNRFVEKVSVRCR